MSVLEAVAWAVGGWLAFNALLVLVLYWRAPGGKQ